MSTRCNIEFYRAPIESEAAQPDARIYKHSDGYPEGVLPILQKLFKILYTGNGLYGQRQNDPEWAAAEMISQFRDKMGGNIYVTQQLHCDIEFIYRIECHSDKWVVRVGKPTEVMGLTTYGEELGVHTYLVPARKK